MVNWALVIIIVIGFVIFYKSTGVRWGKTWTYVIGSLVIFFVVTFGYLLTRPDINLASFDGFVHAFNAYFTWLGSIFDKVGGITGEAIRTDWTGNLSKIK